MAGQAETGSSAPSSAPSSPHRGAARRAALVLATSEYADTMLRQLRSPAGDAAEFGRVLGDADLGGFDVTTVLDVRAHDVRLAVEEFLADRRPDDLALVYLSCHGLVDARRRLYFAASDTVKDRLASTGVEARWLLDQLEECRARRQVVILDCCFSGAFAAAAKGDNALELGDQLLGQGRGRVVLTASRGTEYSFEGAPTEDSAIPGSVFTAALASGIRTGAADTDDDGYISVDDAYSYAFDEMRAAGAQQTPQRWLYGAEGDIVLAKNPAATGTSDSIPARRPSSFLTESGPTAQIRPSDAAAPTGGEAGWGPPRWWKGGRTSFLAAEAAVVVLSVAAVGLLIWSPETPGTSEGGGLKFSFYNDKEVDTDTFWRVQMSAGTAAPSRGCKIEVQDKSKSLAPVASIQHRSGRDNVILQVTETGSFHLDYPPGCTVNAYAGLGDTGIPVKITAGVGDSLAWNPSGTMEITAGKSSDFPCDVEMVDSHGGRDLVTIKSADDSERYTPPEGTSTMYMSLSAQTWNCFVQAGYPQSS